MVSTQRGWYFRWWGIVFRISASVDKILVVNAVLPIYATYIGCECRTGAVQRGGGREGRGPQ